MTSARVATEASNHTTIGRMNAENSPKFDRLPEASNGAVDTELHYPGFDIDMKRGELRVDGRSVALRPKTFALLTHLARHPGRLLGRDELIEAVWRDVIVSDDSLVQCISELRAALDDRSQRLIRTVPRRGYILDVRPIGLSTGENLSAQTRALATSPDSTDGVGQASTSFAIPARAASNFPVQLPPLYGRTEDVAALTRLLALSRVVSVVGSTGIGKTRVAQAVVHALQNDYADGARVVELAPLTDRLLLLPTVARALGHQIALDESGLTSLLQWIGHQRLLLLLDSCEHLLEQAAELVARIVAGAPGVRVLVTSQEPLHIDQEQIFRLDALAVPASTDAPDSLDFGAVQLFVARAQAADPKFTLDHGNASDVIEICQRLDGIPLAIEFAAARGSLLGVRGLKQRLDERLRLLAGGNRTALPRHQTLLGALQWSYGLLTANEQTVFDRLGVFQGTFSLDLAQRVASDRTIDHWSVIDHLASLVDKSLVLIEGVETPRYRLFESSRAFALERLGITGSLDETRRRHAEALAKSLTGDGLFEEPLARMRRIAPDLDNIRAAAAWALGPAGDRRIAVELAAATDMLWDARGFNDEGARLYRVIEPWVDESTPPGVAARFWFAVADLRMRTEAQRQAESALRAAQLFQGLDDRLGVFRSMTMAALQFAFLADRGAAMAALTEAQAHFDSAWPPWLQTSIAYSRVLFAYLIDANPCEARKLANAALQGHRRGDSFFGDRCELMLPAFDLAEGDCASALRRCDDILDSLSVRESVQLRSQILVIRGAALVHLGEIEAAALALRSACTLSMHTIGPITYPYCYVAHLLARQGRLGDAARTIGWIENRAQRIDRDWLPPIAVSSYREARAVVDCALTPEERARYASEGVRLNIEQVHAMAFPPR